jgi:hypothetical protein
MGETERCEQQATEETKEVGKNGNREIKEV